MLSDFKLTDRVAIVTGSGQGMGKAIALGFAEAGADIVVAEINRQPAQDTAEKVRALGRKALVIPTDVRDRAQIKNMVAQTLGEFKRIDILVNNAGGPLGLVAPILETKDEVWDTLINLNLKSVFLCCSEVARVMVAQKKGNIINISSIAAWGTRGDILPHGAYGVAKAGVISLTRTLAYEVAPHVRVNGIAPAATDTPQAIEHFSKHPEAKEIRLRNMPLGRFGTVDEIASAALFLASDASSFITGETIWVSGGIVG